MTRAKDKVEEEMDFLTYFRRMKQLEVTVGTLFHKKERYLIGK